MSQLAAFSARQLADQLRDAKILDGTTKQVLRALRDLLAAEPQQRDPDPNPGTYSEPQADGFPG